MIFTRTRSILLRISTICAIENLNSAVAVKNLSVKIIPREWTCNVWHTWFCPIENLSLFFAVQGTHFPLHLRFSFCVNLPSQCFIFIAVLCSLLFFIYIFLWFFFIIISLLLFNVLSFFSCIFQMKIHQITKRYLKREKHEEIAQ